MRLNHLSLTNFRNYTRLELGLPDRLTVFQGANAQGKTNLLEAIHLLATGRSPRVGAERELVSWLALESPLPYARLVAEVSAPGAAAVERLEMVLELARMPVLAGSAGNGPVVRKQVRINGVPKRGLDLVGRLRVVLFLPEDVSLVAGAPVERRRYLDIALCQVSASYCRALGEYNKVLAQRNALLRRLRDEGGDPAQLAFWDDQAAEHGSVLLQRRAHAIFELNRLAAERQHALTGGAERLQLTYLPSPDTAKARAASGERFALEGAAREQVAGWLLAHLRATRGRDVGAGSSLSGPHRDDFAFTVEDHDLRTFGSRGQQRTAALALKLAEVQMMRDATGDMPLLLLDDVMSELDAVRRHTLLDALDQVDQAVVTTTDWADFTPELLAQARRWQVARGTLAQVSKSAGE